ncbi:MAG: RidA family protein [Nitrospinota bacterium]
MPKQVIQPKSLPVPKAPYSPGIKKGDFIFTAGQVGQDSGGNLVGIGDAAAQTTQCLKNIQAVLAEAGAGMEDVVKCLVFLSDIRYFQQMNEAYAKFFPGDKPGRSTVEARLARPEMLVEIEAVAYVGD